MQQSLNGDIASGYNTPISNSGMGAPDRALERGTYPMIETSFELPSVPGDPFDYEKVNVQVTFRRPGGSSVVIPAFFDGGKTWRARLTPTAPGHYSVVAVTLNKELAHEEKLQPAQWDVTGEPQPGFVRIDRADPARFVFDSGQRFYPLGNNEAWPSSDMPDISTLFSKMHSAGENWSRVWMTHWAGLNLDWPASGKPPPLGDIDLTVAKRWDHILDAAQKSGIYIQMTLQHHGQYSSTVDPNWAQNPYNVTNGGFLNSPAQFFNNPEARDLTRRKLYYILARWGYSPNIMAFELFNEVQFTDAGRQKAWNEIALWHREMAIFLKRYDVNQHLITTSSAPDVPLSSPVWDTVDYIQVHTYAPDLITALDAGDAMNPKRLKKPIFVGEFGPSNLDDIHGVALHNGIWTSAMRWPSGAAQYWAWDNIERNNLYDQYKPLAAFLAASALPQQANLTNAQLPVSTKERVALQFAPGGGFEPAQGSDFTVRDSGPPAGMSSFPAYLQGNSHRAMMPHPLTFTVSYPADGHFAVAVGTIAKAGATLEVSVDGKTASQAYPPSAKDYSPDAKTATLSVPVSAGAHTITVQNTGADWLAITGFRLSPYAPALAALARTGPGYVAAWVYNRNNVNSDPAAQDGLKPVAGELTLPPLKPARYRATWWNTETGATIDETDIRITSEARAQQISTPPVPRDVALYVVRLSNRPARQKQTTTAVRTGLPPAEPAATGGQRPGYAH